MSLLPLVKPCLLQWEGWNGRRCLFQRRLSHLAGVREDLEARPPWPLTGKMGTSSLESGSGTNRVSQGCGLRPTLRPLGPERPHPFPFSGLFGFFFPLFCFALQWKVEPSPVSSSLGSCALRLRWPLGGFCGSKNHFLKEKREFKGFSFVLSASLLSSESPEWGFHTPSDSHHREEAAG